MRSASRRTKTASTPTPAALGRRHASRADLALAKIASTPAHTAEGLQAKARILPMVIDDSGGSMEAVDEDFYRLFAVDVKDFLKPILHEHFLTGLAEKKAKVRDDEQRPVRLAS